jgi:prepilin peptidase CpaA
MAITSWSALWFLPFALPICVWVAWNDMKFMKIPNKAVMALFVVFAVVGLIALPLNEYAWGFVHLVVVLLVCFLLNMIGAIGAGDAKFAAVMAPFIHLNDLRAFLMIFSVVLIAAFATHRLFRSIPRARALSPDWKSWDHKGFPMGLALGGTLACYLGLGIALGS